MPKDRGSGRPDAFTTQRARTGRVGLVGSGAIGRDVAALIREGAAGRIELVAVLVRDTERHPVNAQATGWPFLTTLIVGA